MKITLSLPLYLMSLVCIGDLTAQTSEQVKAAVEGERERSNRDRAQNPRVRRIGGLEGLWKEADANRKSLLDELRPLLADEDSYIRSLAWGRYRSLLSQEWFLTSSELKDLVETLCGAVEVNREDIGVPIGLLRRLDEAALRSNAAPIAQAARKVMSKNPEALQLLGLVGNASDVPAIRALDATPAYRERNDSQGWKNPAFAGTQIDCLGAMAKLGDSQSLKRIQDGLAEKEPRHVVVAVQAVNYVRGPLLKALVPLLDDRRIAEGAYVPSEGVPPLRLCDLAAGILNRTNPGNVKVDPVDFTIGRGFRQLSEAELEAIRSIGPPSANFVSRGQSLSA